MALALRFLGAALLTIGFIELADDNRQTGFALGVLGLGTFAAAEFAPSDDDRSARPHSKGMLDDPLIPRFAWVNHFEVKTDGSE